MSPDTVVSRRTEPVRASVTTTSRDTIRSRGTQTVRVPGQPTDTLVNPTTSTETGGPSTFATITRAGLTASAIAANTAIAAAANANRLGQNPLCELADDGFEPLAIRHSISEQSDGNERAAGG